MGRRPTPARACRDGQKDSRSLDIDVQHGLTDGEPSVASKQVGQVLAIELSCCDEGAHDLLAVGALSGSQGSADQGVQPLVNGNGKSQADLSVPRLPGQLDDLEGD